MFIYYDLLGKSFLTFHQNLKGLNYREKNTQMIQTFYWSLQSWQKMVNTTIKLAVKNLFFAKIADLTKGHYFRRFLMQILQMIQ